MNEQLTRLHARAEAAKLRKLGVAVWMEEQAKEHDDFVAYLNSAGKSGEFVQLEGRKVMVRASELGRINEREASDS